MALLSPRPLTTFVCGLGQAAGALQLQHTGRAGVQECCGGRQELGARIKGSPPQAPSRDSSWSASGVPARPHASPGHTQD